MQRRVNDAEVFLTFDDFGVNGDALDLLQVDVVDILADDGDEVLVAFKLDVSCRSHLVHFVDDTLVMRSKHLCAIVPISLVAVVLFRIVRGSQDDTALATQVTNGE